MEEHYRLQVEKLQPLETLSVKGRIDLYYGDETRVRSEGYLPYGWKVTRDNIDTGFVLHFLERFSFDIQRTTFVVLDNARIHKSKIIRERIPYWQKRGLYLFFLPPYSPHLNIAETLWRKLKKECLDPHDYLTEEDLAYALNRCLAAMGRDMKINFSHFSLN